MCIKTIYKYAGCAHAADSPKWVNLCVEAQDPTTTSSLYSSVEDSTNVVRGSCPMCLNLPASDSNEESIGFFKTPETLQYEDQARMDGLKWKTFVVKVLKKDGVNECKKPTGEFEVESAEEPTASAGPANPNPESKSFTKAKAMPLSLWERR